MTQKEKGQNSSETARAMIEKAKVLLIAKPQSPLEILDELAKA